MDNIDDLLERYLILLDEYSKLRTNLNELQAAMYQNIARANFSAERGLRYGQDLYDDRMQASSRLDITLAERGCPVFSIGATPSQPKEDSKATEENGSGEKESQKPKDPLRWFGVLTPMPLRAAQHQARQAVEDVIPRLASINAEMADIELQVRRARKRRTKAEAQVKKREQAESKDAAKQEVTA